MPFLKIFDVIPGWVYSAALAAMLIFAGLQHEEAVTYENKLEQAKTHDAQMEVIRATTAREATEAKLALSSFRATHTQEVNDAVHVEKEKTRLANAAGAVTRKLLTDATAALSTRSDQAAADPEATRRAEHRADVFGELLGTCDAVAADLGGKAEGLATQVRGLLAYYKLAGLDKIPATLDPLPDGDKANPGAATLDH